MTTRKSKDFKVHPSYLLPPVTQPISIPEVYDWHFENNRDHPLYIYDDDDGSQKTISMGEAVKAFHRATRYVLENVKVEDIAKRAVVAILGWSESTSYVATVIGILRAGHIAFPISPRNSPEAIAHLLLSVSATHILVSSDPTIQSQYESTENLLRGKLEPKKIGMPTHGDFFVEYDSDSESLFEPVPLAKIDVNSIACIYHTSGTTALPNPIYLTHRALYCFSTVPTHSEVELTGLIYSCHSIPIFHGMGWMPLTFPTSVGLTIGVFKPQFPPIMPTPQNVLESSVKIKTDLILTAPLNIEAWAESTEDAEKLTKMKGVVVGGAPLTKSTGDLLASQGVNIACQYGATQTALLSRFVSEPFGMDWEYFKFSPGWSIHLEKYQGGLSEVFVLDSDAFKPYLINAKIEDKEAYATGDLIQVHPVHQDRYRIAGRAEEQVLHSNGERTNPTHLELAIGKDPNVESCIVFGTGHTQCGILIQPRKGLVFDPSETEKLGEYRNAVWPTIMKVNESSPPHSRINKEMIIVTSVKKPFQYTLKQTLRRQIMIKEYEREIEDLYASMSRR
ncbi:acetyl- synthetase [Pyrrhoderma noxium]|uniref:Acetyl-synthetase n=1 Tax=Pyrrhoderma noxium TaxID=2282107 RepID=A0A286U4Y2_9AGAM|nr:acetyl- synthetase [Pyrrhoderma noxium]